MKWIFKICLLFLVIILNNNCENLLGKEKDICDYSENIAISGYYCSPRAIGSFETCDSEAQNKSTCVIEVDCISRLTGNPKSCAAQEGILYQDFKNPPSSSKYDRYRYDYHCKNCN